MVALFVDYRLIMALLDAWHWNAGGKKNAHNEVPSSPIKQSATFFLQSTLLNNTDVLITKIINCKEWPLKMCIIKFCMHYIWNEQFWLNIALELYQKVSDGNLLFWLSIYIYLSIHLSIYLSISVTACMYPYLWLYEWMYVYLSTRLSLSIYQSVDLSISVTPCMYPYLWLYEWMYVYLSTYLSISLCLSIYLHVSIYLHLSVYIYIYIISICLYICLFYL